MFDKLSDEKREKIHAALHSAGEKALAKQDKARDMLSALKNTGSDTYIARLQQLKWSGVAMAMSGERWPVKDKDRKRYLKQSPEDNPATIKLNNIKDGEIKSHTKILIAYSEHADTLSAYAKFFEVLGLDPSDNNSTGLLSGAEFLFKQWCGHNVCTQLANEQLKVGNKEKAESLLQWASADAAVFNIFSEDPEEFNKFMIRERTKEEKEANDKLIKLASQIEAEGLCGVN